MTKLPVDLLRTRLIHELKICGRKLKHVLAVEDPTLSMFPVKIMVTLIDTPGPIIKNDRISHKFTHQFTMEITEAYPYQKPIVKWESQIFHPNLKLPEDGGEVCTKLLTDWGFNSNLQLFIRGIESLLANPNPKSPWGTDSCTRAAEYFNKYGYDPSNERRIGYE